MQNKAIPLLLGSNLLSSQHLVGAQTPISMVPMSACTTDQIFLNNGDCFTCVGGMIPDAHQQMCLPKGSCHLAAMQINQADKSCGLCAPCEEPNLSNTACINVSDYTTCRGGAAPAPTTPSPTSAVTLQSSVPQKCGPDEFQQPTGQCLACPGGQIPDALQQTCVQPGSCNTRPNQINKILPGGAGIVCVECDICQEPDSSTTLCVNIGNYDQCMAYGSKANLSIPANAVGPVIPANAVGPVIPANAVGPVIPANAVGPVIPANAVGPVIPNNAVGPVIPTNAVGPVIPNNAVGPVIPNNAVGPVIPNNAVGPVIPTTPSTPSTPALFSCDWKIEVIQNGVCVKCPACNEPDGSGQACSKVTGYDQCMQPSCDKKTQIVDKNGQCQTCGECSNPNSTGDQCQKQEDWSYCMSTACDWNTHILIQETFSCQKCPVCESPDWFKSQCVQDPNHNACMANACDWENQVLKNGQCESCQKCHKPNFNNDVCVKVSDYDQCMLPSCDWKSEILDSNMNCKSCPICQEADATKTSCQAVADVNQCFYTACDWSTQILDEFGQCSDCGACEKPAWNRAKCLKPSNYDQCMAPPSISCQLCQEPSADNTKCQNLSGYNQCMEQACDWKLQVLDNGQCRDCDQCEIASFDRLNCVPRHDYQSCKFPGLYADVQCGEGEIKTVDNECQVCPPLYQPDHSLSTCELIQQAPTCALEQYLNYFGQCDYCANGSSPDPSQTYCVAQAPTAPQVSVCSYNQILNSYNVCESCPYGFSPDQTNTSCASTYLPSSPVTCTADQVSTTNGCYTCPTNTFPDAQGVYCTYAQVSVECQSDEIHNGYGSCEKCPEDSAPDNEKTRCVVYYQAPSQQTCFHNQILGERGQCVDCGPNTYPDSYKTSCVSYTPHSSLSTGSTTSLPGGVSSYQTVTPGELKDYFMSLQSQIESFQNASYSAFEPTKYTQQVVAGMKFNIIYNTGTGINLEANVYRDLSNNTTINSVQETTL